MDKGRAVALMLMVGLSGCGGGGGSPSSPTTTTAPPAGTPAIVANDLRLSGPTNGGTVSTVNCSAGACSTGFQLTARVTHNQAVTGAQVYLQLMDASARQCGSALSSAQTITAGAEATFTLGTITMECALPATTSWVRATLFGANPSNLTVDKRTGLYAAEFTAGWRFNAPPAAPTPTPVPPPSSVCSGTLARISDLNLSAETVTVTGSGVMTGWYIESRTGSQRFSFPSGFNLSGSVRVQSGPGSCSSSSSVLCWTTASIWNNNGDAASLFNCQGTFINTVSR